MIRTLYDPIVEERGIIKGKMEGRIEGKLDVAKKLILLGLDIDKIIETTELPKEEIEKLFN